MNIEENIEIVKRFCSLDFLYSNTIVFFKEQFLTYQDAIENLLTAYKQKHKELEKAKEKNMELTNSYNQAIKETNEENRRCMLLAVENQDLKEKNKELSDKLTEKICKGVEEEILEEYRQIIIDKEKLIEELKKYKHDAELTKVACCTAQNCEALNNCIKLERELQNADKKWEDKIKANIKELKKERSKLNFESDCMLIDDIDNKIEALESLLEKE